jgi:DNA mismatch repair protein MutS
MEERARTGIDSLKIKYTAVFGYFIEITRSNLHRVPQDYIRKQTVANAERYFTAQLKDWEQKVLHAEERRCALEHELFLALRARIAEGGARLADLADRLATLDVLSAFAEAAARWDYVRPLVDGGTEIRIEEGRHPVIERMRLTERFVPNDVVLDRGERQLLVITGPNMAGKSTVMRQTALQVLMAQVGAWVPAKSARIGVVDRIFTRVGASDNLARGQSTFMVEMSETAAILTHAGSRSLAILDEIGRGTSTYDGLAIAWAVAEHLADRIGCRTLFATHYHELCELARTRPQVKNFHIAVSEVSGRVIFLRRLKEGAASRSYGIAVARLAGLSETVIQRAKEVLANLERESLQDGASPRLARHRGEKPASAQLHLFAPAVDPLRQAVLALDPDRLTPLEALTILTDLRKKASS